MVASLFLDNLTALMSKAGLNQTKLGLKIGVPQQTISNWYRRKKVPEDVYIDKLSEFFKVEPYYFFMKPGTQGDTRKIDDSNDFGIFLDEVAEKTLSPLLLSEWKRMGSTREFVRLMKGNYEAELIVGAPDWYRALAKEVGKYASLDLEAKLRAILQEQQKKREQKSS